MRAGAGRGDGRQNQGASERGSGGPEQTFEGLVSPHGFLGGAGAEVDSALVRNEKVLSTRQAGAGERVLRGFSWWIAKSWKR